MSSIKHIPVPRAGDQLTLPAVLSPVEGGNPHLDRRAGTVACQADLIDVRQRPTLIIAEIAERRK